MNHDAIQAVRQLFESGRSDSIDVWLNDDVELRPPTYGKTWRGKFLVEQLLRFAAAEMKGLRYTDQLSAEELHVMRFEAQVGNHLISGVDLLRTDGFGKIVTFEIFARPPKAVLALREVMGMRVRSDSKIAAMMGLNDTANQ